MAQFIADSGTGAPVKEVSESAFEYLLGEILCSRFDVPNDEFVESDAEANMSQRLDEIGYNVGFRYVEKIASQQKMLSSEPLDIIKFLCKEFWEEVFKKKIDKLQTNHRGVFVLSDHKFKWLEKYSCDDISTKQAAVRMLNIPCGILRGALANLGLTAIVNAEFNILPGCVFNIRIKSP